MTDVVDVAGSGTGFVVELSDGEHLEARAVVLATGSRPGTGWAPAELAADPRLVADPWTQGIPEVGDVVRIATPRLGALVNRVDHTDACPPWRFGAGALFASLQRRGLPRP